MPKSSTTHDRDTKVKIDWQWRHKIVYSFDSVLSYSQRPLDKDQAMNLFRRIQSLALLFCAAVLVGCTAAPEPQMAPITLAGQGPIAINVAKVVIKTESQPASDQFAQSSALVEALEDWARQRFSPDGTDPAFYIIIKQAALFDRNLHYLYDQTLPRMATLEPAAMYRGMIEVVLELHDEKAGTIRTRLNLRVQHDHEELEHSTPFEHKELLYMMIAELITKLDHAVLAN
ncbi:MAG: hypothetical protein AAF418_06380, partial [Pseudomonadota bacterium]